MRVVTGELRSVQRCEAKVLPKVQSAAQKEGVRYEKKVGQELLRALGEFDVVHNPWFKFTDALGEAICCPDFIIKLPHTIVAIEVKLSYVDSAIVKLRQLYCPVLSYAFGEAVQPLVITKNLNPLAPPAANDLTTALTLDIPLLHWFGLHRLALV